MIFKREILPGILLLMVAVSAAWADGCFVWKKGVGLNEPRQKAIIYWTSGREVLVLQVKYEGRAEEGVRAFYIL
jgi:hypothetical protein